MADDGFPHGFLWGTATASYQIEGAAHEDGKGDSIWDTFCKVPGAITGGDTGDIACDHYHRWREDVGIMRALGTQSYRFSVSWPRIFPQGRGTLNKRGLDFYESLVDGLLAAGIEPAVTLYHWDLPQALQDRGGWTNRDTASWFSEYASIMFKRLGDRVKLWMTLNEPQVSAFAGHLDGVHAPGVKDFASAVQASHVLHLAHALGVRAYRETSPAHHRIGIAIDLHPAYPVNAKSSDEDAARIADARMNRWFLDPVLKGEYPAELLALYAKNNVGPRADPADFELFKANHADFIGVNYYFPRRVFASKNGGLLGYEVSLPPDTEVTRAGWEVHPAGLYDTLMVLKNDYGNPPVMISENGATYDDDKVVDGKVQDDDRIRFLALHLKEALRAIADGSKLQGYFLWSLIDNFEWSWGFSRRFGIVHVDYKTQVRTWKKSADWYQNTIATNGGEL
jgi:beta-glucosidase